MLAERAFRYRSGVLPGEDLTSQDLISKFWSAAF
jgi:hypothetical protein